MNYATFAALTNYDTVAAALAANGTDGDAWLLNETQIFQDGIMPKSGPAAVKNNRQTQFAQTLGKSWNEDSGGISTPSIDNTKTTYNASKTPMIRHKIAYYVTDSNQAAGYRRVFGLLEDPATTATGRDDDSQVRK